MDTKGYEKDEMPILKEWIDRNEWLHDIVVDYGKLNKENVMDDDAYIDVRLDDGAVRRLVVEIKEEENTWIQKTRNITMDAVSVFHWKNGVKPDRKRISMDQLLRMADDSHITFGSMYNDSFDILIKKFKGLSTIIALDNHKLAKYRKTIEKEFPVLVNPKAEYGLNDTWQSAFYAIPFGHISIVNSMIFGRENLDELINPHDERKCECCGKPISEKVETYSMRYFNHHRYCMRCQSEKKANRGV